MLVLVINHQPHRTRTDLRRKLVRCLARHGSTFSGVGASDKPGAVQSALSSLHGFSITSSPNLENVAAARCNPAREAYFVRAKLSSFFPPLRAATSHLGF